MTGIGGGGPLVTAYGFVATPVWFRLSEEWGEAVWTASDLFSEEEAREIRAASLRFAFGLPYE